MHRRLLLCVALAAATSACAMAEPIIRVYPDSRDVVWRSGRGIMERQVPGARVAIAFDRQDEDRLAFRVEIENTGPDRVDIEPRQVSFVSCIVPPKNCRGERLVLDPEQALVEIDAARARQKAAATNDATASGVFLLLNAVGTVAAVASGDGRAASQFAANGAAVANRAELSAVRSEQTINRLDAEKANWDVAALRRTTLFPGNALAAEVYLPAEPSATALSVGIRVRGQACWFPFRQVVVANAPWGRREER